MTAKLLTVACFGSRATPPVILDWMRQAGAQLVRAGHRIVSGNSPGADQAWAAGGNAVDPTLVALCLPWESFERATVHCKNPVSVLGPYSTHKHHYDAAAASHPAWFSLTTGGQRLHARNAMIVDRAHLVLGWADGPGGTTNAFALARKRGIPIGSVRVENDVVALVRKLVRT